MAARTALSSSVRPLLVTDDANLLDELLGLAAQAGVELDVAPDPAAARPRYGSAPFVFVGTDLAEACANAHLPARLGVILVGREDQPEPPWDVAERLHAEHVALLPNAMSWLQDRLGSLVDSPGAGHVIAVVGGRGGAGASVLATGLAVTAMLADQRALLVDGDALGGGLDLLLGWEGLAGLRWPDLAHTAGPVSAPTLVEALPSRGELAVLSCERSDPSAVSAEAMASALDAGRRGRDLVVVDLPRRFDAVTEVALRAADRVLLVVPAEVRACVGASRVAKELLRYSTGPVSVVVRGPAPGRLKARDVAASVGLPLAGMVRAEPGLTRRVEHGEAPASSGVGPLADFCRQLLAKPRLANRSAA